MQGDLAAGGNGALQKPSWWGPSSCHAFTYSKRTPFMQFKSAPWQFSSSHTLKPSGQKIEENGELPEPYREMHSDLKSLCECISYFPQNPAQKLCP